MNVAILILAAAAATSMVSGPSSWTIKKSVDQMTDKASCTGYLKGDLRYQLNNDGFYIALTSAPKGVTLRFDDKPARRLRLVNDIERQARAIMMEGSDFTELQGSSRLRYQVLTYGDRLIQDDVQLADLDAALRIIKGPQCAK